MDQEFNVIIQFCFLLSFIGLLNWLSNRKTPSYIVTKVNPETGTEIRRNDRAIWVHINDEEKFQKHLKKQQEMIVQDLKRQGYDI